MAKNSEITWKRHPKKYYGKDTWHLFVDGKRVGRVESIYNSGSWIYLKGKMQGHYHTLSGGRLRLEQLAGVESDWARERRAEMVYLTPEESKLSLDIHWPHPVLNNSYLLYSLSTFDPSDARLAYEVDDWCTLNNIEYKITAPPYVPKQSTNLPSYVILTFKNNKDLMLFSLRWI